MHHNSYVLLVLLAATPLAHSAQFALPEKYTLEYPAAEQFCPPVRTFFTEVTLTHEVINGRKVIHQPNGGYGLPVKMKQDGKNLLHLGADVGWYRVGEPVYAVAAGVVRCSEGPEPSSQNKNSPKPTDDDSTSARRPHGMAWGNLITIEHRLPDGDYMTTVYGHLSSNRLVRTGDIVQVGQQIGEVGRQSPLVNGGYKPHLHFGIRRGRAAEIGAVVMLLRHEGRVEPVTIAALKEDEIEVRLPVWAENLGRLTLNNRYTVTARDGKYFLSARLLWERPSRPGFDIVGYGLSAEEWYDPVRFLREHDADRFPAAAFHGQSARGRRN